MPTSHTLILFGATGDLCGRHLIPALARLFVAGELPVGFRVIATGPQPWDAPTFHAHVRLRLSNFAADLPTAGRNAFIDGLTYRHADVLDPTAVGELLTLAPDGTTPVCYLALPTHLIAPAVDALRRTGLPTAARIAVEKPFGTDLASARQLNDALAAVTAEETHIFRVDHFLGMPVIQAMPGAVRRLLSDRGASISDLDTVSILWEETLALEGRAAFYDRAGALKDLLQNHLVQVLCQILLGAGALRDPVPEGWAEHRLGVLRTVQTPTAEQVRSATRRARYTAGTLPADGGGTTTAVPGYAAEDGVDPNRHTETFAQVGLQVDTAERPGVQFVLRAGKAMGRARRGVLFEFRRRSPASVAGDAWIDLDQPPVDAPPATHGAIDSAPLEQLAYVNVVRDLLSGSTTLSVSRQETELAWQIFTPVLEEWGAGTVPLETYPAGSTPAPN